MTTTQTKTCKHCHTSFDITQEDMDFYAKISPKFGDYTAEIPTPTLCPDCRQRRRLAFRNERKLYRRTCDATQKEIISIYSPDKPYTVYDQKVWRGDARDPLDYGRDFDFSRTFTEQFGELMEEVPRMGLVNTSSNNSEYCNYAINNNNVYLGFSVSDSSDCSYVRWCDKSDNCFDSSNLRNCSFCYQCIGCSNCYNCFSSINLTDCSYCIGCTDLVNKKYCINNQQFSPEEYRIRSQNINCFMYPQHESKNFSANNEGCENSTLMINSYNCQSCSDVDEGNDLRYCQMIKPILTDSIDCSLSYGGSLNMEVMSTLKISLGVACYGCWYGGSVFYSSDCFHGNNLFGCIGLRSQEYCIFNKQYTKESYELLVPRIIEHMKKTGEWGEFFHPSLSPFGYNETVAQEYFPLQKDASTTLSLRSAGQEGIDFAAHGYKWSDYQAPAPHADKIIPAEKLPTDIAVIPDDITNRILRCSISGKPYRIIPQELAFYRKHGLPIPTKHPDVRHEERMKLRR